MKFHLILTLDYEVFGNGSGALCPCVVDPVKRLLELTGNAGAGLDVFADALEFEQMRRTAGHQDSPIKQQHLTLVEQQLKHLMAAPNSVHLHLHPQWLQASPRQQGWQLALDKWRIGDLSTEEIQQSIDTGLQYLQALNPGETTFNCFRAGGWAIQPSAKVLEQLRNAGITLDSTVAPGAVNRARGDWFDFRGAPDQPYWHIEDDVLREAGSQMLEVPITTVTLPRTRHIKALKEFRRHGGFPVGCQGSYAGPNNRIQGIIGKLGKLANLGTVMLDFSTLPAWALIEVTERYMKKYARVDGPIPIVAIGHNKNFSPWSEKNLQQYLHWLGTNSEITFSSYRQWRSELALWRNGDNQ